MTPVDAYHDIRWQQLEDWKRHADAYGHRNGTGRYIGLERHISNLRPETFGNHRGKRTVGIRHNHNTLLPAIAGGKIDIADITGHPLGKFLKNFVSDLMSMGIIDIK